jgi:undecaprenyl diphosphate synthase
MADDPLAQIRLNGSVPRHVAIIMDGNGRWARERHLPRPLGHRAGMKAVREAVEGAIEAGVEVLTLFAFSRKLEAARPEISALDAAGEYMRGSGESLGRTGERARERARLGTGGAPPWSGWRPKRAGTRLALNLCISYSSRAEIARAARQLAEAVQDGELHLAEVTEQAIAARLYTAPWGDPDLLIRTSGEQRISNFLLWQLAYTELYVTPVLWPDFTRRTLFEAILDYQQRERRFGTVTA